MSLDECIHGLGPVAHCTICNGRDQADFLATFNGEQHHPRVFQAKYPGQCPGCDLPIMVGQSVAWLPRASNTHNPIFHEACWP